MIIPSFTTSLLFLWIASIHGKEATLNVDYTDYVDTGKTERYDFDLTNYTSMQLIVRLHVESSNATTDSPLLVVVRQQHEVTSFQVPVTLNNVLVYKNVSRTLCPMLFESTDVPKLIVELTTFSTKAIGYKFRADYVPNFDLHPNKLIQMIIRPAQPVYFRYRFQDDLDSVSVRVNSVDDVCMILSLQALQCPINDGLDAVHGTGLYQTVTTLGSISTNTLKFPEGFFVVLVPKASDKDCEGMEKLIPFFSAQYKTHSFTERMKNVTLVVLPAPNRWDYILPIALAIGFFLLLYLGAAVFICLYHHSREKLKLFLPASDLDQLSESHTIHSNVPVDSSDTVAQQTQSIVNSSSDLHSGQSRAILTSGSEQHGWFSSSDDEQPEAEPSGSLNSSVPRRVRSATAQEASISYTRRKSNEKASRTSQCTINLPENEEPTSGINLLASSLVELTQAQPFLVVSDLSRKRYSTLNRKYLLYFWYLIIISIFYGLPAIQLIMIYQKTLVETGNEDLCYYNFECARPFGIFTAFNNIISNVGYVMLGLLFLAVIARRDLMHRRMRKLDPEGCQLHGIPQHYGLYYSMGLALTMEGIMSACYHMCPSFSNFQFDTAYMYILAMLIILKIYQNRHPDVNASAHAAYMVMAVVIFLGVTGVLYGSDTFWIAFTLFFLLMSIVLTGEMYYMGQWNIDLCVSRRLYTLIRTDGIHCLRPAYLERMILLLFANLINFALAGYGVVQRPRDFSSFLLSVFMINVLMYTVFYILMKLRHRERILLLPILYSLVALVCWGAAIYFFIRRNTTWEVTPAKSRALNEPCMLLNFYDAHDIWHFLSACSMFFSFMMLVNLDDDLTNKPRNQIAVF